MVECATYISTWELCLHVHVAVMGTLHAGILLSKPSSDKKNKANLMVETGVIDDGA